MFPFYLTAFNKCLCIVLYALFCTGATSAPCLIFIFPAVFYIRIVPKDKEPMNSIPKILVRPWNLSTSIHSYVNLVIVLCDTDFFFLSRHICILEKLIIKLFLSLLCFLSSFSGCLFCCFGCVLHGDESEFHNHRLDNREWQCCRRPLDSASVCVSFGKGENWSP